MSIVGTDPMGACPLSTVGTDAITSHNSAITSLETAMSKMQAQSSWLTSQINNLPSMNAKVSS